MKRSLFTSFTVVMLMYAYTATAAKPEGPPPQGGWNPDAGITTGISLAYTHNLPEIHGFSTGCELTAFKKIKRPLFIWTTLGVRPIVDGEGTGVIPYLEAGVSLLFVNIGAGLGLGTGHLPLKQVQLFVGGSLPIAPRGPRRVFYVQSYYRPVFFNKHDEILVGHELGIMLKILLVLKRDMKTER